MDGPIKSDFTEKIMPSNSENLCHINTQEASGFLSLIIDVTNFNVDLCFEGPYNTVSMTLIWSWHFVGTNLDLIPLEPLES